MQRILSRKAFVAVTSLSPLILLGTKTRQIKLTCNAPSEVALYTVPVKWEGDKKDPKNGAYVPNKGAKNENVQFLALVKGFDEIEFDVEGQIAVLCEGPVCHVKTPDGAFVHHAGKHAGTNFAKVVQRRPRNYAVERMEYEAKRRIGQQAALLSKEAARLEKLLEQVGGKIEQLSTSDRASLAAIAPAGAAPSASGGAAGEGSVSDAPKPSAGGGGDGAARVPPVKPPAS